jgi:hypothetical protein
VVDLILVYRIVVWTLAATPADVRIVMSHVPDEVFYARPEHRIDLIIAGHTHGGQVVIPGFGPPLTLSGVPWSRRIRGVGRGLESRQRPTYSVVKDPLRCCAE